MSNKIPRQRMHNPNGGGFKRTSSVHESKSKKLEDKIVSKGKVTLSDLRKLIELEEE